MVISYLPMAGLHLPVDLLCIWDFCWCTSSSFGDKLVSFAAQNTKIKPVRIHFPCLNSCDVLVDGLWYVRYGDNVTLTPLLSEITMKYEFSCSVRYEMMTSHYHKTFFSCMAAAGCFVVAFFVLLTHTGLQIFWDKNNQCRPITFAASDQGFHLNMSHIMRKPAFCIMQKQRRRSASR